MPAAIGIDSLVLGVTVFGCLVGAGAVIFMLRDAKPKPARKTVSEIVESAPYERLGNNLKVAKT